MGSSVRLMFSLSVAALITLSCGASNAQLLVNDWDSDLESWRFDFGPAGGTLAQDPSEGSPDNASGALRLDMMFDIGANGGNNRFAYTGDVFGSETDLTGFDELLFDLKIDQSSVLDAFGNHGFFEFVSRETDNYNFNSIFGTNLPAGNGDWMTFSVPTSSLSATRAFTVQLYGGPSQNIDGDITLWIDNIRLVNAIPEPTTGLLGFIAASIGACTLRRRN